MHIAAFMCGLFLLDADYMCVHIWIGVHKGGPHTYLHRSYC